MRRKQEEEEITAALGLITRQWSRKHKNPLYDLCPLSVRYIKTFLRAGVLTRFLTVLADVYV